MEATAEASVGRIDAFNVNHEYTDQELLYDVLTVGGGAVSALVPIPILQGAGWLISSGASAHQWVGMYSGWRNKEISDVEFAVRSIFSLGGLFPGLYGLGFDIANANLTWDVGRQIIDVFTGNGPVHIYEPPLSPELYKEQLI